MDPSLISVVLPVYNEGDNIGPCLRGLYAALRDHGHELLVCYDNAGDTTLPAIEAMPDRPPTVRLVLNPSGRGVASAIRAGFQSARGDVVVVTMADLSDPPEGIPAMARKIREEGADVVAGSRYMPGGSQTGAPRLKSSLSRAAGLSLRWLAGVGTHDATNNFRAYRKSYLEGVAIESRQGFELALELTVKAHLEGRRVAEIPSSWSDRTAGTSRFRLWKWLPAYLRWYGAAMAEPLAAGAVWLVLFVLLLATGDRPGLALVQGALGAGVLLLARGIRGRSVVWDGVAAGALLHQGFVSAWQRGNLPTVLFCTALALGVYLSGCRRTVSPADPGRRLGRLGLAFGVALWFSLLAMPEPPGRGVDPSWKRALAEFLQRDAQAGIDYVFTFGPLGCFYEPMFREGLFGRMIAWELGLKLIVAVIFLRLWSVLEGRAARIAFALLCLLLLPLHSDSLYYLAILGAALNLLRQSSKAPGESLPELLLLSAASLVKFSFALAAAAAFAVVLGSLLKVSVRRGIWTAAQAGTLGLLFWVVTGQEIGHFPDYVGRSLQIATAYSEAMALVPDPEGFRWGLGCLAALAIPILLGLRKPWSVSGTVPALLVGILTWFAWKAGFTRAEPGHYRTFFAFAPLAAFMIPVSSNDPSRWRAVQGVARIAGLPALLFLLFILEIPALQPLSIPRLNRFESTLRTLFRPGATLAGLREAAAKLAASAALPRIREAVGRGSVDVLSHDVDVVLLNDLRWKPRPCFQSYVAHTAALMDLNARFLAGADAPDFLLLKLEPIDFHLPGLEDAPSLRGIARNYRLLLKEGGYLLLRRRSREEALPPPVAGPVMERRIAWGESVGLDAPAGTTLVARLEVDATWKDRLARLFTRSSPPSLELETASGTREVYCWIPSLSGAGFLLDPLLRDERDVVLWLEGRPVPRIRSLRPLLPEGGAGRYGKEVRVRIEAFEGVP